MTLTMVEAISPYDNTGSGGSRTPRMTAAGMLAAVAALATAACADGPGDPREFEVGDSAGVALSYSGRPASVSGGAAYVLAAQPDWVLGGEDDTTSVDLHPMKDARVDASGRIVVLSEGGIVMWLSADGAVVAKRGGKGGGPEEIRYGGHLIVWGDSVAVLDQAMRLAVLTPSGPVRYVPLAGLREAIVVDRLASGEWLTWGRNSKEPHAVGSSTNSGYHRPRRALLALTPDGATADTVGVFPGDYVRSTPPPQIRIPGTDIRIPVPALLGLAPRSAFAAIDGHIVTTVGETHEIDVITVSGELLRRIRWQGADLDVTPSHQKQWRAWFAATTYTTHPELLQEWVSLIGIAGRRGTVQRLLISESGEIWAQVLKVAFEPEVYEVFHPEGRWLATVAMPGNFRLTHVGHSFVLGIAEDSLGLHYVHRYPLLRQ